MAEREILSPPIFYTVLIAAGAVLPKKAERLKVRMKGPIMTLTIEIPDEEARALTAKASEQGVSAQQYAQQILKRELELQTLKLPLSARIRELWSDMPADVRAKLPEDGASQIDHYIHGHPRRNQ